MTYKVFGGTLSLNQSIITYGLSVLGYGYDGNYSQIIIKYTETYTLFRLFSLPLYPKNVQ